MKKTTFALLIFSSFILAGCPDRADHGSLRLYNTSGNPIYFYLGDGYDNGTIFPDTTLPATNLTIDVPHRLFSELYGVFYIESLYANSNIDTICFFFLHEDVINQYSWEIVRDNYLILIRYDLSLSDLRSLKYRVEYPPSKDMKNMKMYPSYDTYK